MNNNPDSFLMFPDETKNLARASALQLIYQGLALHYASFWGPLRTSKTQKAKDTKWLSNALIRWTQEYGGNAALLVMIQLLIVSNSALLTNWLAATALSLLVPPMLTVLQMFLDNFRTDSRVFFDRESSTGMTIKAYRDENENLVWSYFNHFALPIGAKNGRGIRAEVHRQAELRKTVVTCSAQNQIIADFYLKDKENGVNLGGKRPLMVWNYSAKPWRERKSSPFQALFGIHSTRNSGQIPLGGRGKLHYTFA
jgi:hypothetical protein